MLIFVQSEATCRQSGSNSQYGDDYFMEAEKIKAKYDEQKSIYLRTLKTIKSEIEDIFEDYSKEYNLRHKYIEGRIKELPSILNKLKGKKAEDLKDVEDIV